MCDLSPIFTILIIAEIALLAAIVSCSIAIGLNLGVVTAGGAPIAFGIALASALVASLTFAPAAGMLSYCGAQQCAAVQSNAAAWFMVVAGALATAVGFAYLAIALSGVPIAGVPTMAVTLGLLVAASLMLPSALDALKALQACMAAPEPPHAPTAFLLGYITGGLAVIAAFVVGIFVSRAPKNPKEPTEPKD